MNHSLSRYHRNYAVEYDRLPVKGISSEHFLIVYLIVLPMLVLIFGCLIRLLMRFGYISHQSAQNLLDQCNQLVNLATTRLSFSSGNSSSNGNRKSRDLLINVKMDKLRNIKNQRSLSI